ncbi:hypothetical protein BHM03_00056697 [Ensete ventricosum]|nr:hypothetical protein BHM03_00056697 [Ensete ventricosum]
MTTKHKSPTSGSSIHPCLSEVNRVDRASWALSTIPFTIFSKDPKLSHKQQVQNDMSNKIGIYRKHMQNNEI